MVLPSHLVRHSILPSDEDYKTLYPLLSPQRWDKCSNYTNFTPYLLHHHYLSPQKKTASKTPLSKKGNIHTKFLTYKKKSTIPISPLERGNHPIKPLTTNKKQASQTSPLERGRGYVTPVHSYSNQKQPPNPQQPHRKNNRKKHPRHDKPKPKITIFVSIV